MNLRWMLTVCGLLWAPVAGLLADEARSSVVKPVVTLLADAARDQDDLCIWVDPQDAQQSLVITSDKKANRLFVYDLAGTLLQELEAEKPGNIDLRQNVSLGGRTLSLAAVTIRTNGFRLQVYQVNPERRRLERIDAGLPTVPNYGGCLYHSPTSGRIFFITTSEEGVVAQYDLTLNAAGRIAGEKVREWTVGKCEGAVADDAAQVVYISEETKGVWKFDAEPDAQTQGTLVAPVGEHGIQGDVEGLAILPTGKQSGYLVVSDQGGSRFHVFERGGAHRHRGSFAIAGAAETDGVEVIPGNFGPDFPRGIFGCHTDGDRCAVLLTSWKSIAETLGLEAKVRVGDND
jgi:3-phytase